MRFRIAIQATAIACLASFALLFATGALAAGDRAAGKPTNDRDCLILALYHEAKYESRESILKHAFTIVWRVKRNDYPNTVCNVVFQRFAFQPFNNGVPPIRDRKRRDEIAKIADQVLIKAFPSSFGGDRCMQRDIYTGTCIARKADLIKTPIDVATHYAVADCYFLGRSGYDYTKNKRGECVPRWSLKMVRVAEEPCALVKNRPCKIVFWKEN